MTEILLQNGVYTICLNGTAYGCIVPCENAQDTFRKLEDGAWQWHRHTDAPTDRMRMELLFGRLLVKMLTESKDD